MSAAGEIPLGGGQTSGLVRVGSTVRRPPHARSPYVHELLAHLERVGFYGAPRFQGIDERGRSILTFIPGEVPAWAPETLDDARIASAAMLIRGFHDATAGSHLAEGQEVVCHRDLGAHNIVFDGAAARAIIDWDEAVGPGARLFDVGDACWSFADVAGSALPVGEQARRLALFCDAYGWEDHDAVVDEIAGRFGRALADHRAAGRAGAVAVFEGFERWMGDHGAALRAACQERRDARS